MADEPLFSITVLKPAIIERSTMQTDDYSESATMLIRAQKTMVLSTCNEDRPWNAPVYYVYVQPGFFFFSSPRSRHIQDVQEVPAVAAAIFSDSNQWEDIQGVQMTGRVAEIQGPGSRLSITARYLLKFPFAREFLADGAKKILDLRDKVRLYRFSPQEIYYVNNRMGFGRRVQITSLAADSKEL